MASSDPFGSLVSQLLAVAKALLLRKAEGESVVEVLGWSLAGDCWMLVYLQVRPTMVWGT